MPMRREDESETLVRVLVDQQPNEMDRMEVTVCIKMTSSSELTTIERPVDIDLRL